MQSVNKVRAFVYTGLSLAALAVVLFPIWRNAKPARASLPTFGKVPQFSLTTEHRSTFSTKQMEGNVTIADFIFTLCAGPCPLMSAQMQKLQMEFHGAPALKLVSFSVDPKEDTPEVLTEYAHRFGANQQTWSFLTGDEHQIYDLTRNGFRLSIAADSDAIAHSTKFVLIDQHADIRGYYDSGDDSSYAQLVQDTRTLLEE